MGLLAVSVLVYIIDSRKCQSFATTKLADLTIQMIWRIWMLRFLSGRSQRKMVVHNCLQRVDIVCGSDWASWQTLHYWDASLSGPAQPGVTPAPLLTSHLISKLKIIPFNNIDMIAVLLLLMPLVSYTWPAPDSLSVTPVTPNKGFFFLCILWAGYNLFSL